MFAIIALVLLLVAAVLAVVPPFRSWPVAALSLGLACWLIETGAGLIP
jgi:hypothetical protein